MSVITKSLLLITRFATPAVQNRVSNSRTIARWVAPTLKELKRRKDKLGPAPPSPRSSYLEWNYEAELYAFGKRLGEEFDRNLLKKVLTQREYANLQEFEAQEAGTNLPQIIENNHELIQEGETFISNYIRAKFNKQHPEPIVSALHEYLTNENMLAHIGSHIGLRDLVLTNEFPVEEKTLSDTFKALVGALKYSKGESRAENFVKDFVLSQLNGKEISDIWEPKEPYEYLMKLLNEKGIKNVEPRLCNEAASNTILACFQVGIYSNKDLLGIGWGESIHIAKDTAALDAILKIYKNEYKEN